MKSRNLLFFYKIRGTLLKYPSLNIQNGFKNDFLTYMEIPLKKSLDKKIYLKSKKE